MLLLYLKGLEDLGIKARVFVKGILGVAYQSWQALQSRVTGSVRSGFRRRRPRLVVLPMTKLEAGNLSKHLRTASTQTLAARRKLLAKPADWLL